MSEKLSPGVVLEDGQDDPRNNGDNTPRKMPTGRPFQPGNPGKPKGARSHLGENFLKDVRALWAEQGKAILDKCAQTEPMQTAKMVAGLLPREFLVQATMNINKTNTFNIEVRNIEEFAQAYDLVQRAQRLIGSPDIIDVEPEETPDV